jgi:hypothetical protein
MLGMHVEFRDPVSSCYCDLIDIPMPILCPTIETHVFTPMCHETQVCRFSSSVVLLCLVLPANMA